MAQFLGDQYEKVLTVDVIRILEVFTPFAGELLRGITFLLNKNCHHYAKEGVRKSEIF